MISHVLNYLDFVDGVDKNGTIAVVCEHVARDFTCELFNLAPWDEQILQPRVRNFPQAFFLEFQLGNMQSVEKLNERNF